MDYKEYLEKQVIALSGGNVIVGKLERETKDVLVFTGCRVCFGTTSYGAEEMKIEKEKIHGIGITEFPKKKEDYDPSKGCGH